MDDKKILEGVKADELGLDGIIDKLDANDDSQGQVNRSFLGTYTN